MHLRTRRRLTLLAIGGLVALAVPMLASPAQAHDELVSTNPADGASVAAMPDSILLTFEEPAERVGSQVIVRGPSGNVAQGAPVFLKNTVTQAVTAGAPAGKYTVLWRVTSDDGHPVSGSFTFTAAAAAVTATPESGTTTSSPSGPAGTAGSTAAPSSSAPASSGSSSAPRWLWLLILLALLVPVAIFVRRRPGGPHDASPGAD